MVKVNNQNSIQEGPQNGDVFDQATVKFVVRGREDKTKVVGAVVSLQKGLVDSGYTALVELSQTGLAAEDLKPNTQLGSVVIIDSYRARDGKTQNANGKSYKASRVLQVKKEREVAKQAALKQASAEERILTVKVTGYSNQASEVLTCRVIDDPDLEGTEGVIALSEITMTPSRRYPQSKSMGNLEVVGNLLSTNIKAMVLPESTDRIVVLSEAKAYEWTMNEKLDNLLEDLGTAEPTTFTVDVVIVDPLMTQFAGDVFLSKTLQCGITVYAHTTTSAWSDRQLPLPQVSDRVEATLVRTFDHILGYKMFSVKPVLNQATTDLP